MLRAVFQYAGWIVGLPLELLIISALVRGLYRRFPFLLLYALALFLTTVIEISVNSAYFSGLHFSHSRASYYWIDEGIRQALIFTLVISWIYIATTGLRSRNLIRTLLIAGSLILAGGSFLIHYNSPVLAGTGKWHWMSLWVRDLDFSAAVLDLALWTLLLASRHKDTQLLLLSGALGIQFTGEAIGQSLRLLFHSETLSPGDVVDLLTNLAGLWIWWQALRPHAASRRAPALERTGTGMTRPH